MIKLFYTKQVLSLDAFPSENISATMEIFFRLNFKHNMKQKVEVEMQMWQYDRSIKNVKAAITKL